MAGIFKAAFFDLDGVIVDTEGEYTKFWNAQGEIHRPEIPNFGLGIKGYTLAQVFSEYFADMPEARAQIEARLDKFEREMPYNYIAGVLDFVKDLRAGGIKTAIVTSSNLKKMASVFAARAELRGLFDAVVTSEDVSKSKPDPECYIFAAKKLGCKLPEGVVFEDSFSGLKAAKASQMRVVGLATTAPRKKISPFCDVIIDNYKGLTRKFLENSKLL